MKKTYTDINIVLDKSGSMGEIIGDTIGGFNNFLKDQQEEEGEAKITLVQFNTVYEFTHKAVDIKKAEPLNRVSYMPGGGTALLDAVGRCINETGARLAEMKEEERPHQVVFVIITDGEENSSREFNRAQIKQMIEHQQEKYNWEFVFLGANQDSFTEAGQLGITKNVANFTAAQGQAMHAYGVVSKGIRSYRSEGRARSSNIIQADDQGNIKSS